ncbi:MAG: hypothetical protein GY909_16120 [Oligoflexia bacterium]|nr:hypothetical protein [Oligoflexia bacterium]
MNHLKELITNHKDSLLDSHLKYGGVCLSYQESSDLDGRDYEEVCIELDEGNIAFSVQRFKGCTDCGCMEFSAHQVSRSNIVVDYNNEFISSGELYDAEKPYGPYICTNSDCGKEYETLPNNNSDYLEDVQNKLKEEGIGVYLDRSSFLEKINQFENKE